MYFTCRWLFWLLFVSGLLIGIWFIKYNYDKLLTVPAYESVQQVIFYDQGWSEQDIKWFYHTTQGSMFPLEYEWFLALEQPVPTLGYAAAPFHEKSYLGGFGFLFDENIQVQRLPLKSVFSAKSSPHHIALNSNNFTNFTNQDGLPVGFAVDENYVDPVSGERMKAVGLTCAACHTGQLNYNNKGIRIEGAGGMVNFAKFQNALGLAMMLTACEPFYVCDPFRFERFARRVLGSEYNRENKATLKQKFKQQLAFAMRQAELDRKYPPAVEEGFGRLDALNRIGNFLFGLELYEGNYRIVNAPVKLPYLWGTSWYDWVQYNGSVKQPMTRNAGEALGVFATINLVDPAKVLFQSSLQVENLYRFEKMLGGDEVFAGLRAPVWPEEYFGAIDQNKAKKGEAVYRNKCMHCHLPPMNSDEICAPQYWTEPNAWGLRFLKVTMVNIDLLGTDPIVATDWAQRFVDTKQLGLGLIKAEAGLPLTVAKAVDIKYDEMNLSQEQRDEYDGLRENLVRSPLCYKARPLEGIWASPPYLHNGSVPNLYQLLSPVAERDRNFYLGSREYDPKHLGYKTTAVRHGFKLDTTIAGNHNTGHEFRALTTEEEQIWPRDECGSLMYPYSGVLGPTLAEYEREQLIEYLKTLTSRDLSTQTNNECPQAYIPPHPPQTQEIDLCR